MVAGLVSLEYRTIGMLEPTMQDVRLNYTCSRSDYITQIFKDWKSRTKYQHLIILIPRIQDVSMSAWCYRTTTIPDLWVSIEIFRYEYIMVWTCDWLTGGLSQTSYDTRYVRYDIRFILPVSKYLLTYLRLMFAFLRFFFRHHLTLYLHISSV
jgi:hypothetical protein